MAENTQPVGLKCKVRTRNVDGSYSERVEIISDPVKMRALLHKHRKSGRIFREHLSEDEEHRRILLRMEKRRLQQKLKQAKANLTAVCSACGMIGHKQDSFKCPLVEPSSEQLCPPATPKS